MKNKIFLTIVLFFFSLSAYSAQCPLFSDWQHQKGDPWVLSKAARDAGWRVRDDSFRNRDETFVGSGEELTVRITKWSLSGDWVYCEYALGTGTYAKIAIAVNAMRDVDRLSDGSINSKSTFSWESWGIYRCNTHANTPQNCSWAWQKGKWETED